MTSSLGMIRGRSNVVTLTNNSGGALVAGDVCIQDTSADEKVTTTTSAASVLKVFVAAESIASGAAGRFYESGYCPLVNVSASVTRGRFLFTHTVAKQAAESATYGSGAFGKILKSGTTPSAIIYSATAQISGTGVTRSGSTTGDHLAVWNGSNADSIKDGGAVSAGAFVQLSQTVLGSDTSTISFGTISGSYSALRLVLQGRGSQAATEVNFLVQFNGDTGNNYDYDFSVAYNSTNTSVQAVSSSSMYLGGLIGANGPANAATQIDISIVNYAGSTFHKTLTFQSTHKVGANGADLRAISGSGFWKNTAAVTGITLSLSAGNFITGTVATLYGLT